MTGTRLASEANRHLRFVLVRTSHPGNIGSAARAIRTMGFDRLGLVAPAAFPHAQANAMAAGADAVLEAARVSPGLGAAIADCTLVIGATARQRGVQLPEWTPREAAARVLVATQAGQQVALVFGNEQSGLSNDEIKLCHAAVHIPSDPTFSSLNLAQAVQVLAYELRVAVPDGAALPTPPASGAPANSAELEGFFGHLAATLEDIDFHKGRSPHTIMHRLRRLFLRANPDQRELRVLRGILADAQRMAQLARERSH